MPLTVQIFLSVALVVLVSGVVLALLGFPQHAHKAPGAARERVRSLAGLLAVLGSDAAIVIVVIWGAGRLGGLDSPEAIALVTGAFTAVSTMATAYLGIKAVSNTAQVLAQPRSGCEGPDGHSQGAPADPRGPEAGAGDQTAASSESPGTGGSKTPAESAWELYVASLRAENPDNAAFLEALAQDRSAREAFWEASRKWFAQQSEEAERPKR
ncbi:MULTISPECIES: hypothetical protein [Streptomyces]|uniref:Integral membrane protein n=1 Tax=Streptomyces virginiae TaxID=1961 RepID=A0ABZ1T473_STRVG|nr:hypothetical protein [Streptomyces virginiae]WTB20255.1 hypothetical protein OG253_01280 [Streptomyces virginiae]